MESPCHPNMRKVTEADRTRLFPRAGVDSLHWGDAGEEHRISVRQKLMCNMVTITDNSPTLLAALENCRDFKYSSHKINMGKLDLTSLI